MKKDQLPKNRLVYLEAFPFYHSILDLCMLEAEERDFALLLAEQLLQGKLDVNFQSHSQSEEKLHHLYFESKNWERIGGQRCTALGFPLFLFKQESSVRLVPLLFWPLNLDPDPHRPNFWNLRSIPERGPMINPLLSDLFPSDEALPLPPWKPSQFPTTELIQAYGNQLAQGLGTTWQETWPEPFPVPPLEVLGDLADQKVILPCMVIGSFKPLFSVAQPENAWAPGETIAEKERSKQPFEISQFNPHQAAAWEKAHTGSTTLIENKSTAQTQEWVFNLIYNALSNGERCLVLSDRISRLAQLQGRLSEKGLDWLSFLLKDPFQDAYLLTELLKARAAREENPVSFPKNDYKAALAKSIRQKEKLDLAYEALQKPLLGDYRWTDLVGLFLKSSAIEGKELLSNQLTTQEFLFQYEEYEELKRIIHASIPLYNRINTLKHPLTAIHPGRFLDFSKADSQRNLDHSIKEYSGLLEKLHHEVLRQTDAYALKLNDYFENGFLALNARLQQSQEMYSDHSFKFGEAFEKSGAGVNLKGIFQSQARAIKNAREETTQSYLALARYHESHNFFDFPFLSASEAKNMGKVKGSLLRFREALGEWRQHIRERVLEEVTRLNKQTVFPDLGFQEPIAQLEERIDSTLLSLNQAKLYGEAVDANMLTIPKKQKFLDSLLEKLETTKLNLRDFDPFYDWQRHWLQLTEPQQRLIRALIKVKPNNWESAFESWYFHHCLNRNFSDDLPTDDQALQIFNEARTSLLPFLPALIRQTWLDREQKAFKNWKKSNKPGYQAWLGKSRRENSPSDWFQGNWDSFLDLFPVWMLPDTLAPSLFEPDTAPELDWVIVWEHQEIEPAIWEALAPKVKHWIVIGDSMGKVWSSLREKGWPVQVIRSLPPESVSGSLSSDGQAESPKNAAQIVQVSGLYDYSSRTNEAEAQETLKLLNDIRPTPSRTFPSVAILTFSVEQRDLIATYLLQIKQRNLQGSDKIRSLERNGLAVLYIDEFPGSRYDQYILSSTLGPVNTQGALPADLSFFASGSWDRICGWLLQSNIQSAIVLHSFTDGQLTDSRLAGLKILIKLLSSGQTEASWAEPPGKIPGFNLELQGILRGYFDEWEFKNLPQTATHLLPLVLSNKNGPEFKAAVISDAFLGRTPSTSYTWEWEVRRILQERGVHLQNAWSVLCWRNPRQEARKIASRIISAYNRTVKDDSKKEFVPEDVPGSDPQ